MENLDAFRPDKAEEKSLGPTVGGDGVRNMDPSTAVDADLDRVVLEGIPTVNLGRGVPDPTPFGSQASPTDQSTVRRVLRRISGGRYGNEITTPDKTQSVEVPREPEQTGRLERRFRNLASRLRKPSEPETPKPQQPEQPPQAPKPDVYGGDEAVISDQAEQLAIHEQMADAGKWTEIHNGHYDWWAYPIDRGSAAYGEFYSIAGEPLQRLKQNQAFLDSVADEIKIQAEALGWSLYERKFVEDPDWDGGQDWRKAYPTRIWKMTRSAQILGLEDEFESLKLMQQSLSQAGINFNHKKYWSAPGTIADVPPLDSSYERTYGPIVPSTDPYPKLFDSSKYSTAKRMTPEEENAVWEQYDDYEVPTDPVLKAADELATLLGESVEDDDLSYPYLDIRRDDRLEISDLLSFALTLLPASPGDGLGVDRSETAYALTDVLDQHNFYEDDISTMQTLVEVLENPDLLDSDFDFGDPTAPMAWRPKLRSKLTMESEWQLIDDWESGSSTRELAQKYGISLQSVYKVLKRNSTKRPIEPYPGISKETESNVVADWESGSSVRELAQKYGISNQSVYNVLKRNSIKRRILSGPSDEEEFDLIADWESGSSARDIAQKYGISITTVYAVLRKNNIERDRRTKADYEFEFDLITDWESGSSAIELARKYGISLANVYSVLKKNDIKRPIRSSISDETETSIVADWESGSSVDEISQKFGIHPQTVYGVLKRNDTERQFRIRSAISDETKLNMVADWESGSSVREIAQKYSVIQPTVYGILRRSNTKRKFRPESPGVGDETAQNASDDATASMSTELPGSPYLDDENYANYFDGLSPAEKTNHVFLKNVFESAIYEASDEMKIRFPENDELSSISFGIYPNFFGIGNNGFADNVSQNDELRLHLGLDFSGAEIILRTSGGEAGEYVFELYGTTDGLVYEMLNDGRVVELRGDRDGHTTIERLSTTDPQELSGLMVEMISNLHEFNEEQLSLHNTFGEQEHYGTRENDSTTPTSESPFYPHSPSRRGAEYMSLLDGSRPSTVAQILGMESQAPARDLLSVDPKTYDAALDLLRKKLLNKYARSEPVGRSAKDLVVGILSQGGIDFGDGSGPSDWEDELEDIRRTSLQKALEEDAKYGGEDAEKIKQLFGENSAYWETAKEIISDNFLTVLAVHEDLYEKHPRMRGMTNIRIGREGAFKYMAEVTLNTDSPGMTMTYAADSLFEGYANAQGLGNALRNWDYNPMIAATPGTLNENAVFLNGLVGSSQTSVASHEFGHALQTDGAASRLGVDLSSSEHWLSQASSGADAIGSGYLGLLWGLMSGADPSVSPKDVNEQTRFDSVKKFVADLVMRAAGLNFHKTYNDESGEAIRAPGFYRYDDRTVALSQLFPNLSILARSDAAEFFRKIPELRNFEKFRSLVEVSLAAKIMEENDLTADDAINILANDRFLAAMLDEELKWLPKEKRTAEYADELLRQITGGMNGEEVISSLRDAGSFGEYGGPIISNYGRFSPDKATTLGRSVSIYGGSNAHEAFAESHALVYLLEMVGRRDYENDDRLKEVFDFVNEVRATREPITPTEEAVDSWTEIINAIHSDETKVLLGDSVSVVGADDATASMSVGRDDDLQIERVFMVNSRTFAVKGPDGDLWYLVLAEDATPDDYSILMSSEPSIKPTYVHDANLSKLSSFGTLLGSEFGISDPIASMSSNTSPNRFQIENAKTTNVPVFVAQPEFREVTPLALFGPNIDEDFIMGRDLPQKPYPGFYDWHPSYVRDRMGFVSDVEQNFYEAMRSELLEAGGYLTEPITGAPREVSPINRPLEQSQPWYHATSVEFFGDILVNGLDANFAKISKGNENTGIWMAGSPASWVDQMPDWWSRPMVFLRARLGEELERELFSINSDEFRSFGQARESGRTISYNAESATLFFSEGKIPPESIEILNQNGRWVPISTISNPIRKPGVPSRPMLESGEATASMAKRRRGNLPAKKKKKLTEEDVSLVLDYESGRMMMSEIAEKLGVNKMAVSRRYRDTRTSMNENVYEALGFKTPTGIPDHLRPVSVVARRASMRPQKDPNQTSVVLNDLDKTLLEAFASGLSVEMMATALRVPPSEARRRLDVAHRRAGLTTPTERQNAMQNLIADEISMMRRRGLTERKIKDLFGLSDEEYSSLAAMRREEVTDWFPKLTDDEFMVAEMYFSDLVPIDGIASRIAAGSTRRRQPASFASRQMLVTRLLDSAVKKLEEGRTRFGDENQSLTPAEGADEKTIARIEEFLSSGNTIRSSDVISARTGRLSRRIDRNSSPADEGPTAPMSAEKPRTPESLQNFSEKPLLLPGSDRSQSPKDKSGLHGSIVAEESENSLASFLNGPMVMNDEFLSYPPEKISAFAAAARKAGLGAYQTEGHSVPKVQGPVMFELADRIAGREIVDRAISTAYPTYDELMDIFAANAIGMAKLMATAETEDIRSILTHIFSGEPLPGSDRRLWTYDNQGAPGRSRVDIMGLHLLALYDGPGKPSFMNLLLDATGIPDIDREAVDRGSDYDPIDFSRISIDESSPFAPIAKAVISNMQKFLDDWQDFASRWARAAVETMSVDAGLTTDQIRSAIETHWRNASFDVSGSSGTVLNSALNLAHHATVSGYAPLIYLQGPESAEIPAHEFFHAYVGQGFTRHGEYAAFRGPWEMYDSWGNIFFTAMNNNSAFWMNVINEEMKRLGKNEAERSETVRREMAERVARILDRSSSDPRYERLFGELLPGFGETEIAKLRPYVQVALTPWGSAGWKDDPNMPKATVFIDAPGASVPKWLWPFGNGSFGGVKRYIDPDTGQTMQYDESTGTYLVNPNRR